MADQQPVPKSDKPTLGPILGIIALIAAAATSGFWAGDMAGIAVMTGLIAVVAVVGWRWGARGILIMIGVAVLAVGICTAVVLSTWE